jgi:hypothetical protein
MTRLAPALLLIPLGACGFHGTDAGPVESGHQQLAGTKAALVHVAVHMDAGDLSIGKGGASLLDASYRYSARLGAPEIQYDQAATDPHLTIRSPQSSSRWGNMTNTWTLQFTDVTPLDFDVHLGAGTGSLDLSHLALRGAEVHVGAGQLTLDLGNYHHDVAVTVEGGVGSADIHLPRDQGVVVEASGGLGSIQVDGLTQRNGRYYNAAYVEGQPAISLKAHGGIGEIHLSVQN